MEDLSFTTESQEDMVWNEQAREFVGKNTSYYIPRFLDFKDGNKKISWNWMGFISPFLWLVYRKMYLEGIILYVLSKLATMGYRLLILHSNPDYQLYLMGFFLLAIIAPYLILGFTVNRYYYHRVNKLIEKNLSTDEIERKSGVSVPALVILVIVTFIFG